MNNSKTSRPSGNGYQPDVPDHPPSVTALAPRTRYAIETPAYEGSPAINASEDDDNELIKYWRTLLRHKWAVILGSLVGLLLGFGIGIPMKPVFRATTALEVLTMNGEFFNQKQVNPTTTNDNNFDTSEEQTQAKLIQSNAVIVRVIEKLLGPGKTSVPVRSRLARTGWRSWLHMNEPLVLSEKEALLLKAADTLDVRPTARTRVLEISVDSTNPQLATDFANTLTQEFIARNIEARWATAQSTSEWLRRELEDAKNRLRSSEDALQAYARTSGLIFTDDDSNLATEKLQQLQQNLSAATADRIAKQSTYELAQKAPPESLGDVLKDEGLTDTLAKLNDLRSKLADTSTVFAPESSKVQRLQAEEISLQMAFDRQKADIVAKIKNDFTEATRKERLLAAAFDAQTREVTGQDEKAIQYTILKRDVESNRQLYDTMLQQMKQASIASAIRAGNVRVVDPAVTPDTPISPNFKLNSMLGLLAGLLSAVGFVTLRDRADRTFQQPGDLKLWTELIELATIPSAALGAGRSYFRTDNRATKSVPRRKISASLPIELVTSEKQSTMSAEAFRSALTSILFLSEDASRPKVLVFTSANPADGKTTVASNIAIAAAEIRMNVLLVDADLRRPRLHDIFKVSNETGLVDILCGEIGERSIETLIKQTSVPNLSVITAGPPTQAAAHLLYSPMWTELLDTLRGQFDMIIVDTPPMLQMTDARVAARAADAVVLVARSNITTRDVLVAARDRLREDRTPILGAILNDWDPRHSPNGYYGYYNGAFRSNYYTEG
jgi:capsular exopolysaccharide synthesis family protein